MSDTRVVLVKPGDVLMIGNVTIPDDEDARAAFDINLAAASAPPRHEYHVHVSNPIGDDVAAQIRHGLDYIHDRYGKNV